MPKVGDLIVYKASSVSQYAGLVTEIHLDKYGHQRNVLVEWSTRSPPDYNEGWGYAGSYIHNQRKFFDVIRNGVELI